jgi:hypothetical protein
MSDFIIQFGDHIASESIVQSLSQRPWLQDRPIHSRKYPWGQLILQESPGMAHAPYIDVNNIVGCVGRPRSLNKPLVNTSATDFCLKLANQWGDSADLKKLLNSLTGMFALVKASAHSISIMTDHMGAQPVYSAHNSNGDLVGIGTDVETLAIISGRQQDFDQVSLGELLVHNNISFPFSSRDGITEFQPASVIGIQFNDFRPSIIETILWMPEEHDSSEKGLVDELVDRMRAAGSDIAMSADSIGVTLSGGLDSRAVLAVLPQDKVTAITYVTHENYETDTARIVAEKFGCNHVFACRSEDYFSRLLLENGPAILGMERRAMLHGVCIPESGLSNKFDVIVGGQLSDTYLKDHYMPKWQREYFRPKGPKERLGVLLRKIANIPQPIHLPGIGSNLGRYRLEQFLSAEVRQQVRSRRAVRLDAVKKIRPSTADEWVRFWPTSRQDDSAHIMGNSKLFAFETLFLHRYITDFAPKLFPVDRYSGAIASKAFAILYGELGYIHDANTGQLPGVRKRNSAQIAALGSKPQEAKVWNNVPNSWFDLVALQKYAPEWQKKRRELETSDALDMLDSIIDRPAAELIANYAEDLGPTFKQMFFQIALMIDKGLKQQYFRGREIEQNGYE